MRFILYCCRPAGSTAVDVGVGQQGKVAGALDSGSQLTLITCLGSGDTARNDLAGLGDICLQGVAIFVVDLFHAFGGETAELTTTQKTCHEIGSSINPWIPRQRCSRCHCRSRWSRQCCQGDHEPPGPPYVFPPPCAIHTVSPEELRL